MECWSVCSACSKRFDFSSKKSKFVRSWMRLRNARYSKTEESFRSRCHLRLQSETFQTSCIMSSKKSSDSSGKQLLLELQKSNFQRDSDSRVKRTKSDRFIWVKMTSLRKKPQVSLTKRIPALRREKKFTGGKVLSQTWPAEEDSDRATKRPPSQKAHAHRLFYLSGACRTLVCLRKE